MLKIDFEKYPFPRRFRHHTNPNFYFPAKDLKILPESYPPLYEKIDWSKHFGNGLPPDELDIGCGKGIFLLRRAYEKNDKNILGIELRKTPAAWIKTVIEGEKFENCAVLWYSAANGLPFIDNESIENAFYLFPDPWPKKKHIRRRAFNADFLSEIDRILKPQGCLFLATDVPDVHRYHLKILEEYGKFDYKEVECWDIPITNKETFCIKKNIPVSRLTARKKTVTPASYNATDTAK